MYALKYFVNWLHVRTVIPPCVHRFETGLNNQLEKLDFCGSSIVMFTYTLLQELTKPLKSTKGHIINIKKQLQLYGVKQQLFKKNSAVLLILRSWTQRCQWQHRAWLSDVNDTVDLDSAMSMIPQRLTQRCQWHRGAWLSDVNDTTETGSAMSMIPRRLTSLCRVNDTLVSVW